MVALWAVFAVMLFVLEPLVLHGRMAQSPTPEADFRRMKVLRRVHSVAALVTVLGAVAGAHGLIRARARRPTLVRERFPARP